MTLRYAVTGVMNNAGFTSANRVFVPTNAFDVDTAILSTSMPGFTEWSGLYRRYRTRASRIKVDFMNLETTSLVIGVLPIAGNPGANHSAAITISEISQPVTKTKPLGPNQGFNVATARHSMTTAAIGGGADMNTADDYSSLVTAGPLLNWYWDVFCYTGGVVLANGVLINVLVDLDIEFFDVASPAV